MTMTKQQQVILASMAGAAMILQGCDDKDSDPCSGEECCAGLPTLEINGVNQTDPTVVLNWRILYDSSFADGAFNDCAGCVFNVFNPKDGSQEASTAAVVAAFGECGAPEIVPANLPTATKGAAALTFAPPQPNNVCDAFPNESPEDWVDFCTGDDATKNADCCNCAIARLNWQVPENSKYPGLGSDSATIDSGAAACPGGDDNGAFCGDDAVSAGCGFTAGESSQCTYANARKAFMDCGSGSWDSTEPDGFVTP